jgi:hypothetical protein
MTGDIPIRSQRSPAVRGKTWDLQNDAFPG